MDNLKSEKDLACKAREKMWERVRELNKRFVRNIPNLKKVNDEHFKLIDQMTRIFSKLENDAPLERERFKQGEFAEFASFLEARRRFRQGEIQEVL